jgi:thiol-disulfide isomerase/thioredoxin
MLKHPSNFVILAIVMFVGACDTKTPSETFNDGATANSAISERAILTDLPSDSIASLVKAQNDMGKAVLINVWATWCGPCVEEFPDIVALREKYKDQLEVIFISADFEEDRARAITFLKEQNVQWETYFKTGKDEPFILALSESWTGALPFSKVYNPKGEVVDMWENKATYDTFEQAIFKAIK